MIETRERLEAIETKLIAAYHDLPEDASQESIDDAIFLIALVQTRMMEAARGVLGDRGMSEPAREDADAACIHRRIASTCLDCLRDARDERDKLLQQLDRAVADAGRLAAALEEAPDPDQLGIAGVKAFSDHYREWCEAARAALEQHGEGGAT